MPEGGFTYFRSGAEREADAEAGPQATKTASKPESEDDRYPTDGTIPDVKQWVGEDRDRAQVAVDREGDRDNPRITLLDYLDDLLADDDDES